MSKKFALLLKKAKDAEANHVFIEEKKMELRARLSSRGDVEWEATRIKAEKLSNSVEITISFLKKSLPIVENNPNYSCISEGQRRADAAFDRFLKSYLVPNFYFRARHIDLVLMSAEWDKVLADQESLAHLYSYVLPVGAQLGTGKRKKAEKRAEEEKRTTALLEEIQFLKSAINRVLELDSGNISGKSKVITSKVVSDWQKNWKKKFSILVDTSSHLSSRDLESALKRMLGNITASKEMVEEKILPTEMKLSKMKYWLEYLTMSPKVDRDLLDPKKVQDFRVKLKEAIASLFIKIPDYWIYGDDKIKKIVEVENFVTNEYKHFVSETAVSAVLHGEVNWEWVPDYNDTEEGPFLPQFAYNYIHSQPKDGLPGSKDYRSVN